MNDVLYKSEPKIIAEIGCNHKGNLEIAKEMIITAAKFCKVDVIKFQKRCNREYLTPEEYNAPHPHPENAYGSTYGAHREALEFTLEQHAILKQCCEDAGVIYSTSVWDMSSAKEIASLKPLLIKIPSAANMQISMLKWLCKNYSGQLHLSFGMTTHEEEKKIVDLFKGEERAKDLVIYGCTSGYPVAFEDLCLYEIVRLKDRFGKIVGNIGFSGHHLGIAADIAAMTLGANWIERHFTLDRTWKGTDHAASLEPDGMRRLTRDLRNVYKALSYKSQELLPVEVVQRKKLKHVQG